MDCDAVTVDKNVEQDSADVADILFSTRCIPTSIIKLLNLYVAFIPNQTLPQRV